MDQLVINSYSEKESWLCKNPEGWVNRVCHDINCFLTKYPKGPFSDERQPDFTPCFEDT